MGRGMIRGALALLVVAAAGCSDDSVESDEGNEKQEQAATERDAGPDGSKPDGSESDGAQDKQPPAGVRTLFYLNTTGGQLLKLVEGGEQETVLEGLGTLADGIALDLEAGHVYWTVMGVPSAVDGAVMRADLDGSNKVEIVESGATMTPKQLKIDHEHGKLYWSDREGMRVMRSNMDGSDVETLVTVAKGDDAQADPSNHCVGMALDVAEGMVYWTQKGPEDGGKGTILRVPMELADGETSEDRSDIEVLFEDMPEPIDLDLDLEDRMIYWSDRGDNTINRAPMDDPAPDDREILVRDVSEAIGVALDEHAGEMFYTSLDTGLVGQANMDGSDAQELVDSGAILTGIAVGYIEE